MISLMMNKKRRKIVSNFFKKYSSFNQKVFYKFKKTKTMILGRVQRDASDDEEPKKKKRGKISFFL